MQNQAAAWWTSAVPAAAAHRGAPAPVVRAQPAAWPAPDPAARAARGVPLGRLADDLLAAGGRPVGGRHAPACRCAGAAGGERRESPEPPRWGGLRYRTAATQS